MSHGLSPNSTPILSIILQLFFVHVTAVHIYVTAVTAALLGFFRIVRDLLLFFLFPLTAPCDTSVLIYCNPNLESKNDTQRTTELEVRYGRCAISYLAVCTLVRGTSQF